MKLKYYLRGLGMGIIFTTLILMISGAIHNDNLTEEEIIREAEKLGMVMAEDTEEETGALWMKENTLDETETEESETLESETVESETDEPESDAASTDNPSNDAGDTVSGTDGTQEVTYVTVYVYPGDSARMVAERLQQNGLVENAESFRQYIADSGKAESLNVGEFRVPMGAEYEQILGILLGN